jgi:predicted Rossmann-fold nucleotide-binding protein
MVAPFSKIFNIHNCKTLIKSKRSQKEDTVKVAIVGSRTYENKQKIREMIFLLKQKFPKLEIVSGGAGQGADKYAKKFALEMNVGYLEFNPACSNKNLYSAMPDEYYGHNFHVSQLFHRNELMAMYADQIIAFRSAGESKGTDHAIKMATKYGKQYIIIGDKV